MNNKYFFLSIALISLSFSFGQYTTQTGLRISDATATTPSPGIKYSGSADMDGVLYNSKFINNYGLGFYNKSNGDSYNNGMNSYLSGYFGIDFFTSSQLSLRISREGNVGIGTETPEALLHVNGDIKTNHSFIFGNSLIKYDQGGAVVLKASTATATPYIDFNRFGETGYFTSRLTLLAPQVHTNNEPKLTLLGSTLTLPHGVEFLNSPWGNGFGAKIYGTDNGDGSTSLRFGIRHNTHSYTDAIVIKTESRNVGIGTNNPDAKLTVNGDIHAKEVKIDLAIAPDYVFEKYYDGYSTLKSDYKMPTLQEVEAFTKENKHLPEVPSAQEIKENGLKLGEMNAILLQKVEELTLYLIEQNKEIEKLKTKVDELSKK